MTNVHNKFMAYKTDRFSIRLDDEVTEFVKTKMKKRQPLSHKVEHLIKLGMEVYDIIDAVRMNRKMLREEKI